jgi:urease accessory protein
VHDAAFLQLLQLADSALPIGAAAHSFGLETLAEEGDLRPEALERFFQHHLEEAGALEALFAARAWQCGNGEDAATRTLSLSQELSARRPARESREASLKLGRRFAELVNALIGGDGRAGPLADPKSSPQGVAPSHSQGIPASLHYPVAFGVAGAVLGIPEQAVVLGYLQQSIAGLISACQRLMPLGQVAASRILWNLKPAMIEAALRSCRSAVGCSAAGLANGSKSGLSDAADDPKFETSTPFCRASAARPIDGEDHEYETSTPFWRAPRQSATTSPVGVAPVVGSSIGEISCFQPLPELASIRHGARHASTETRLFIS